MVRPPLLRSTDEGPIKSSDRNALISLPIAVVLVAGTAWAGSQGGETVQGVPLFGLLVGAALVIQWVAFIPALLLQTEKFFDLVGSVSYVVITGAALLLGTAPDARSFLLAVFVSIWALRLGSFLYRRIHTTGGDRRFDDVKPSFIRFLNAWTLQGLWITITIAPTLAAITAGERQAVGPVAFVGFAIWTSGFVMEVVADSQKRAFRADPVNRGSFISSGLWAWSRHPNYFGEIVLWTGAAIIAAPALRGWQWITLVSPFFVFLLLSRLSGIPKLETRADREWGGQPKYEAYKATTPVLIPRMFRKLGKPQRVSDGSRTWEDIGS